MAISTWQVIQERFEAVSKEQGEIVQKLVTAANNKQDASATKFLEAFALSTAKVGDKVALWESFIELTEQHICGGNNVSPESDLVRVVPAVGFLFYYSRKFPTAEEKVRRDRIQDELDKIRVILRTGKVKDNVRNFLEDTLNLTGRLRRRGYPLWFTTQLDVEGCSVLAEYVAKLGLGNETATSLFRFDVGRHHVGSTPNVRYGETDHDPAQTMTCHLPTAVDGMWHDTFVPGGFTAGRAKEYVSKLDNADAIDHVEMIE